MTSPTSHQPLATSHFPNALALGSSVLAMGAAVERDAEGVPTAWRLLKQGSNPYTRDGAAGNLELSAEQLGQIVANHQAKGSKIPVDSRHYLFRLAEAKGISEAEALGMVPDGRAALAFGSLEQRPDGLWLKDLDYRQSARPLVKEGVFRYFSPVIRGLADGNLRVTSVALDNNPALDNLDALAASAESDPIDIEQLLTTNHTKGTKGNAMKELLAKLAKAVKADAIDLSADGAAAGIVAKIETALAQAEAAATLVNKVRDALALGAETAPDTLLGHMLANIEKAKTADALKTERDALALAAETAKRDKIIEDALNNGKLTNAMVKDVVPHLNTLALSGFIASLAPNASVPPPLDRAKLPCDAGTAPARTPEQEAIGRNLGVLK